MYIMVETKFDKLLKTVLVLACDAVTQSPTPIGFAAKVVQLFFSNPTKVY